MQTQTQTNATRDSVVAKIRKEASQKPAFNAVFQVFAKRQRARAQVTMHSLTATMKKEGFKYSRDEYAQVLKFLAHLGLGRAEFNRNNKFKALKDIKVTLQSIGLAATAKSEALDKWYSHNKFSSLPNQAADYVKPALQKDVVRAVNIRYPAELTVKFSKDEVTTFKLPLGLSPKELGLLLASQYSK